MAKPTAKRPAAKADDQAKADPSADAKADAVEKPVPDTKKAETVLAGVITAISGPFRRLNMEFSKEPVYVAPDYFDPDEIRLLMDEPKLSLTQAEVDPTEVTVLERPEGKPDPDEKE